MGQGRDGLGGTGSAWTPAGGLPDPGVPAYEAGDVTRTDMDDNTDEMELATSPEVIEARAEIEQTRAEMSETIDALKDRLNPQRLADEAKESVRDATIGRAEDAVHNVTESAREMFQDAGTTAKGAGQTMMETVKQNPVPAALIGIGAGWLLMSARQNNGPARYDYNEYGRTGDYYRGSPYPAPSDRYGYSGTGATGQETAAQARERIEGMKDKARDVAGDVQDKTHETVNQVRETASQVGDRARDVAQNAQQGFGEMLHENPFGIGLAALALGMAVGYALPETRQENRLMGEARDTVMERVSEKAQDVAQKARSVADEVVTTATETAKHEAQNQGLTS